MASKLHVYVTRGIPPLGRGLQLLKEHCTVRMYDGSQGMLVPRQELLKQVAGTQGILVMPPDRIDPELLDAAGPQLKVVGTMSVGLEHIDLQECAKRNVKVGYTPDILSDAVAEGCVGLALATARRDLNAHHNVFLTGFAAVVDGGWDSTWGNSLYLFGKDLKCSVVGIVGLGRIGLASAKRFKAFEVSKILYSEENNPKDHASEIGAEFVSFSELLDQSDFVIACCSVNPGNIKLFNADAFKRMKKSAIFVNSSRGALVDQEALYEALKSGEILAAGLDVTTPEPLPWDSPLLTLDNCTILPHLGSASVSVRNEMADLTVRNILAGLNGQPLLTPVPEKLE